MHKTLGIMICFLTALISACAVQKHPSTTIIGTPNTQETANPAGMLEASSNKLNQAASNMVANVTHWDLNGKLAIHQGQKAWSAALHWQQQGSSYHISLFGPMGANSYELSGHPGQVRLASGDGKVTNATTPEELLRKQTGSALPVSHLYYWVRGLEAPSLPSQKQYDAQHNLRTLQQAGWNIQYVSYRHVNNMNLPDKIYLSNSHLNAKLIINSWNLQ